MLALEQQIFKQIEKAKSILIVFPGNWSSDAVAASLALFLFLKKTGREVEVAGFKESEGQNTLAFLPGYQQIQTNLKNLRRFIVSVDISQAKVNQIKYTVENQRLNFIISPAAGWFKPEDVSSRASDFKHDLIITIGAADLESLGKIYDQNVEFFYKTTIINIDQQAANEAYGQINFLDLNAVAVSEILFYLLKTYRSDLISEDIATCLLAGIICGTKNFKTANLTPRTLLSTSELIDLGAKREEIINHLYRSRDISTLKLWGKVLSSLQEDGSGLLLWSRLKQADLSGLVTDSSSFADIIDELIANLPQAKIIVIFQEISLAKTLVLVYSTKNINALDLMKDLKPKGTNKSAFAELNQDLDTAEIEIIAKIKSKLDKLT